MSSTIFYRTNIIHIETSAVSRGINRYMYMYYVDSSRYGLLQQHCSPRFVTIKLVFLWCLYVLSSVLWCPLRFPPKTTFGSFLSPAVFRRATLFVFVWYSGVQHILCCVFVMFVLGL